MFIVPTDQNIETETTSPPMVDRDICKTCKIFPPIDKCSHSAIARAEKKARIELSRCHGVGICIEACPFGAVKIGERAKVKTRELDLDNVDELRKMSHREVLRHPSEILARLSKTGIRPKEVLAHKPQIQVMPLI